MALLNLFVCRKSYNCIHVEEHTEVHFMVAEGLLPIFLDPLRTVTLALGKTADLISEGVALNQRRLNQVLSELDHGDLITHILEYKCN